MAVLVGGSNAPSAYDDAFKYDLSNNRVEEDVTGSQTATVTYAYNSDDQLKTETRTGDSAYTTTYGYDNNGSLTSKSKTVGTTTTTTNYRYDARNRMIRVDANGDTTYDGSGNPTGNTSDDTVYTYDNNGVRVSESTAGATTYYLNDPQNPTGYTKGVEESATLNGTPKRAYVLGLNVIAQCDNTNGLLYLLKDGQGSTRALVRSTGSLVEQYNYDAFGTLLVSAGAQSDAAIALTSWLFGGDGIYDQNTGWTYRLSRFTDGFHFSSLDSRVAGIGDVHNANLYTFVGANPIAWSDPLGQDELSEQSFDLTDAVTAENGAGFLSADRYAQAHFGQIGAYTQASFAIGDFMQNTIALDQQALFAVTGTVGGALGGLISGAINDVVVEGINALLFAEQSGEAELAEAATDIEEFAGGLENAAGKAEEEMVRVYRGTANAAENDIFQETGHILSDAARTAYRELGNDLDAAYAAAEQIHEEGIEFWGNEADYAEAHGTFGTELSKETGIDRTFVSVTTDPDVAGYFAGPDGQVYEGLVPKSALIPQSISGATESEFLLRLGTDLLKPML